MWGDQHGWPSVGGTFPPAPCLWRFWCRSLIWPQTNPRELERCWLPYKLQHQGDEGRGRIDVSTKGHVLSDPLCSLSKLRIPHRFSGPLRIPSRSSGRGTITTSVPTTPRGGLTMPVASLADMKPPTFTNSQQAWPTVAPASASPATLAKRRRVTSRTAVHLPTVTRTAWPRPWSVPVCWTKRGMNPWTIEAALSLS